MTGIHVQHIGDKAVLPQQEFNRLLELARRGEAIMVQTPDDDVPTVDIMRLVEQGRAFDFWKEEGEEICSAGDGEPG